MNVEYGNPEPPTTTTTTSVGVPPTLPTTGNTWAIEGALNGALLVVIGAIIWIGTRRR